MKVKDEEQIAKKRQQILEIAGEILTKEGLDQLSIRKIAGRMNQTPGILYHYFKNKEEILLAVVEQGYQGIVSVVREGEMKSDPQEQLKTTLASYIRAMLERRELFLLIMGSKDERIQGRVHILAPGIEGSRESMHMLCCCLRSGVAAGSFTCTDVEARAQVIWCATYGLISRIVAEEPAETQKNKLIEEHLKMILASMKGEAHAGNYTVQE